MCTRRYTALLDKQRNSIDNTRPDVGSLLKLTSVVNSNKVTKIDSQGDQILFYAS